MNIRLKSSSAIISLVSFLFIFACQSRTTEWKGTVTVEGGISVVQNPREPMYRKDIQVLDLEEDLTIGESTGEEGYLFSQIGSIAVDNAENIYVLDEKEKRVMVFDNAGTHIRTFGRAGQGPGEFRSPLTLGVTNRDEIVIEDIRSHLSYFSTQGEHIRDLPTTKTAVIRVTLDSRGNIMGIVIIRDKDSPRYEIQKFDPEMNFLHVLDSRPTPSAGNEGFNPFRGSIYYAFDKDDRIVCGTPDQYEIKIFDPTGKLAKKIVKDYDPVVITEEEKKEVEEEMPPEMKLAIPRFHNAFRWISTDDEGRIYVMTWERVPDGEGYFYDLFDAEGRYLAQIPLEFRPSVIKKNKFYTVREDEDGFHIVKRYRANWRIGE